MAHYYVKQQLEKGGFTKAGEISPVNMKEDVSPSDPAEAAERVKAAVSTVLANSYNGELYFSDQDPSENEYGTKIVADQMFKLKELVNAGKKDVYYFNKV